MSKLAEVTKIILNIDGKEIELSPKDAKSLYIALKELVGEKEVITIPQPYPVYPYQNPYRYWTTYGISTDGVVSWSNAQTNTQ